MFSQVSSALGEAVNSRVITISESVPDKVVRKLDVVETISFNLFQSGFLVHHLMSDWIRKDPANKVVIVGLEHTFGHYFGVANSVKTGNNLLKLRQAGTVKFWDGLKNLPQLLEEEDDEMDLVKRVYSDIVTLVEDNTLVMVDQISMLSCLGLGDR